MSIIYIFFAILALCFLIFIHELGHYWMARRTGMRVETFSIGFGKPIYTWEWDGVKWQLCWILLGGYVKIAGMNTEEEVDPYEIPDGFYGKKPLDRIKVAFMGPFVNLLFAFILFSGLWFLGGRDKNFSEFTQKIGWMDPQSELYVLGIRPGDEVTHYDDYTFQSSKDHLFAPMTADDSLRVRGFKIDYQDGIKTPFDETVHPYPHPSAFRKNQMTSGVLDSANYIIYDRLPNGQENPLLEGAPLKKSGIQYGDRILWVDGELVFSLVQLSDILNDGRILVTLKRGNRTFHRRVPRVKAGELRPDSEFREELIDWQYEANLNFRNFENIYAIPYNLTFDGIVEDELKFVDKSDQDSAFPEHPYSDLELPLQPGDRIIAVQGRPVSFAYEILKEIQEKRVNIIVQRDPVAIEKISFRDADNTFNRYVNWDDLAQLEQNIGTTQRMSTQGKLHLLNTVMPRTRSDFPMSEETRTFLTKEKKERMKLIEEMADTEEKSQLIKFLHQQENLLVLGLPNPQDRKVIYNPIPTEMFSNVFQEIWRTLSALFTGALSFRFVAGPVGIVHALQTTTGASIKEAVFWIGVISLNLGILNLLPIPILDGGNIVLSFFEMITRRRVNPKTLEKIVVFFGILLILFFIFITYQDISRIFGRFLF